MSIIKVFAAIFDEQGRMLLVRRADGDRNWTSPGGTMDGSKPPDQELERIVHEETGLVMQTKTLIGVYAAPFKDHIFLYFNADLTSSDPWRLSPAVMDIGYFEQDKLPQPMYERTRVRIMDAFDSRSGVMRTVTNQ
jgi:ADP-ribose pyrophosphatase YjhB (NUDIX family)